MRSFHFWLLMTLAGNTPGQADSLWRVWNDQAQMDSLRLEAIQTLAWKAVFEDPDSGLVLARYQLELAERTSLMKARYMAHTTLAVGNSMKGDYPAALIHFDRCLRLARTMGDREREANTYSNLSNVYRNLGDLPRALEQLQRARAIEERIHHQAGLAGTLNNMGNIYAELGEYDKALEHYQLGHALYQQVEDRKGEARTLTNLGTTHMSLGQLELAEQELSRSLALFRVLNMRMETGSAWNNLGRVWGLMGDNVRARSYLDSALQLFEKMGNKRHLTRTHQFIGQQALLEGRPGDAVRACETGAKLADELGSVAQARDCQQCLSEAYARLGQHRKAYIAQGRFLALGDSLRELNDARRINALEMQLEFKERLVADSLRNAHERFREQLAYTERIAAQRQQRNAVLFAGIGILALAGGLYSRLRYTRRSRSIIQRERDRSDELLLNILPAAVAEELKDKGETEAMLLEQVTVLFSDFKGFTALSEQLGPKELVKDIHECFSAFDRICDECGLEKIKTIGDAYMAAGGLPMPNATHAADAIRAALRMRDFIAEGRARKQAAGLPSFEVRIGIHTGPVVAGVVGLKKFQYDIWGDTVNTASRMESSGEAGRVNISEATRSLVKDEPGLIFIPRGMVQAKGKGELPMYFVERAPA